MDIFYLMNEEEIKILEMCVLMTYYHLQNDTGKNQISVCISLYLEQGIVISEHWHLEQVMISVRDLLSCALAAALTALPKSNE